VLQSREMDITLVIDCVLFLLTTLVAIYAIRDTREQVREMIFLDRNRVYSKVRTDMMLLFVDPSDQSHTAEVVKGLEEFCLVARALEPQWTEADLKAAVENEALYSADVLVRSGHCTWKKGLLAEKVNQQLLQWQSDKNRERIKNLLGKKRKFFLF
jgi:hypothetical protein